MRLSAAEVKLFVEVGVVLKRGTGQLDLLGSGRSDIFFWNFLLARTVASHILVLRVVIFLQRRRCNRYS